MAAALPTLRRELNKKSDFDTLEQEAYLGILRTASVLSAPFERLFRQHGLTDSMYNALRILRGGGERGKMCGEIADELVSRVPDVTRLVDRLEKAGLAQRVRSAYDRRAVFVKITARGLDVVARLDAPLSLTHSQTLGHLNRVELTSLCGLLAAARAGCGLPPMRASDVATQPTPVAKRGGRGKGVEGETRLIGKAGAGDTWVPARADKTGKNAVAARKPRAKKSKGRKGSR